MPSYLFWQLALFLLAAHLLTVSKSFVSVSAALGEVRDVEGGFLTYLHMQSETNVLRD